MRAWSFDKAWREVNGKVPMTSSIRGQYAALALTVLFAVATLVASSPFASARTLDGTRIDAVVRQFVFAAMP